MAVAAAAAILATSAGAASTNLLTNGTFEGTGSGSLTGWKGQNASLALVPGDGGGFAAQVTRTAKDNYAILTAAKTVPTATAGTTYSADGRFMAPVGKSICLKLKETGAATTSAMSCAPGTGAWATIPEVSYTVQTTGDGLNFLVLQQRAAAGDRFAVDNLSVTQGGGVIQPPASLHAVARSSTEIDLGWTASSGAVGYHVYRDNATTPTATVDAPDTTYADTGLDPSSTHAYTVTAFDASQESGPSNQAGTTTPADDASVSIAAAGDIACNPADVNYNGGAGQNGFCQQAATANLIAQGSYDRVLALGDEQYDCGSLDAFNTSYDASWGRFVGKTLPVPGNHEAKTTSDYGEAGCSKNQTGYFTYFANHGVGDRRAASTATGTTASTSGAGT